MADTFISHGKDKGFWIAEAYMQLCFHYIYEEIRQTQHILQNKKLFLQDMKFKLDGYTNGYMTLGWPTFIESDTETRTMIKVLQNVNITLQQKGTNISVAELNAIETDDSDFKGLFSRKAFPTAELVKVIDALIQILQGTWDSDNYDMKIDYGFYD